MPMNYMRHIQIYVASFFDPLQDISPLLGSKSILSLAVSCPNLLSYSSSSCYSFYFEYRLTPQYFANNNQTILDTSGEN